jgi:hypothetical protein
LTEILVRSAVICRKCPPFLEFLGRVGVSGLLKENIKSITVKGLTLHIFKKVNEPNSSQQNGDPYQTVH